MKKRIGFIGTGKITSAVVEGFCKHGNGNNEIIVSSRNRERSARLSSRFSQVKVAKKNQEVIDHSEIVFFALLPHKAPPVIKELRYREDLKIISLIPMIVVEELEKMVYPAVNITRAIPLPPAAYHFGSVLYYPESGYAAKLLSELGNPIPLPDEHQLHILWAVTGLISPFFTLLAEISNRAVEYGVDRTISNKYIAAMFGALSNLAFETDGDFLEMADEAATPGGLNEQARKMVAEAGGYKSFIDALDAIVKRFPDKGCVFAHS
jgi:pyrroline-5-carboxylate reductase